MDKETLNQALDDLKESTALVIAQRADSQIPMLLYRTQILVQEVLNHKEEA